MRHFLSFLFSFQLQKLCEGLQGDVLGCEFLTYASCLYSRNSLCKMQNERKYGILIGFWETRNGQMGCDAFARNQQGVNLR